MADPQLDARLTQRGVVYTPYRGQPGDIYFRLTGGRWFDLDEAQGRHDIRVEVLDEAGQRLVGIPIHLRNGGDSIHPTEPKTGEEYAQSIPMFNAGWPYTIWVGDKSDTVSRLGLGTISEPNVSYHTSYGFRFQRAVYGDAGNPPRPPQPPSGDNADWERVLSVAYGLVELARRNLPPGPIGNAQRSAGGLYGPELAAVTGVALGDEWTPIAKALWPDLDNADMALCWRRRQT